jgi:hypothetical protein
MSTVTITVLLLAPVAALAVAHRSIAATIRYFRWLRWCERICGSHDLATAADVLHATRPDAPTPPLRVVPTRTAATAKTRATA